MWLFVCYLRQVGNKTPELVLCKSSQWVLPIQCCFMNISEGAASSIVRDQEHEGWTLLWSVGNYQTTHCHIPGYSNFDCNKSGSFEHLVLKLHESQSLCWNACIFWFHGHLNILGTFIWNCYTPAPPLAEQSFMFRCSESIAVQYNRPAEQSLCMTRAH